jgi:hypothetical protein
MHETTQYQPLERNEIGGFLAAIRQMICGIRDRLRSAYADNSQSKRTQDSPIKGEAGLSREDIPQEVVCVIKSLNLSPENEAMLLESIIRDRLNSSCLPIWHISDGLSREDIAQGIVSAITKSLNLSPENQAKLLEIVNFWQNVSSTDFVPTMDECLNTFRFLYRISDGEDYKMPDYLKDENLPSPLRRIPDSIPGLLNVVTVELVKGLSDYFLEAAEKNKRSDGKPFTIVEVGAGNGKLAHSLQEYCDKKSPGTIRIIATDNGVDKYEEIFEVERLSHDKAIERYRPNIILNSWMPPRIDFSKTWRQMPYVKEYILIGEWDGCTGSEDTYTGWYGRNGKPRKRDGFKHSRLDIPTLSTRVGNTTSVVSFRRV